MNAEHGVLQALADCIPGAYVEGDSLCFPQSPLRMSVTFLEANAPAFHLEARLTHPDFFGPLVESTAGVARDEAHRVRQAAHQLRDSVLEALLPALSGQGEAIPAVALAGRTHMFRACPSGLMLINAQAIPGGGDLWQRMGEAVGRTLGSQTVYWVKLYMSKLAGGGTSCEVRVNGQVVPELTQALAALCADWDLEGAAIKSAKQFVVLAQPPQSRVRCPYTWRDAEAATGRAIGLFQGDTPYEALPRAIEAVTPCPSLAEDIFGFMPEIMAAMVLHPARVRGQVQLCRGGQAPREYWFTQFRSWHPITLAVQRYLYQARPAQAQLMPIIGRSALLNALNQAAQGGSRLEDMVVSQLFRVSEGYEHW